MGRNAGNELAAPILRETISVLRQAMSYIEDEALYSEMEKKLEQAEGRLREPYLKLSVIGDFSCGKSTLLNAVFGRELLSMDMMPTTAVPTYIRWDRSPSDGVRLVVHDDRGRAYDVLGEELWSLERYVGKSFDPELGALIDALTTDNALREKLSKVEISFPSVPGREWVCLIDTPGINPGMEGTREHVDITRRLLSEESDAAIILFPSSLVLTGDLLDFLETSARHLLRESYFIITKFDLVRRQRDRELMPELVSRKMRDLTGRNPKVYTVSAGLALDYAVDPEGAPPGAKDWAERFQRDIGEIFSDVAHCRERIVKERLTSLLKAMIEKLTRELESGNALLEKDSDRLSQYSPEQMKMVIQRLCGEAIRQVNRAENAYKTEMKQLIYRIFSAKRAKIRDDIQGKKSAGAINSYLRRGLNEELKDVGNLLPKEANKARPDLEGIYQQYEQKVRGCYADYRIHIAGAAAECPTTLLRGPQGIPNADISVSTHTETTVLSTIGDAVESAFDVVDDLLHLEIGEAFDDLFWLLGGAVENILDLFTPLDTRKQNVLKRINESISQEETSLTNHYIKAAEPAFISCRDLIRKLPQRYEKLYEREFSDAMERITEEHTALQSKLDTRRRALTTLRQAHEQMSSL